MEIGLRKRQRSSDSFVVFRVLVWTPPNAQMNSNVYDVHAQWFSHQKIKADSCDVKK